MVVGWWVGDRESYVFTGDCSVQWMSVTGMSFRMDVRDTSEHVELVRDSCGSC